MEKQPTLLEYNEKLEAYFDYLFKEIHTHLRFVKVKKLNEYKKKGYYFHYSIDNGQFEGYSRQEESGYISIYLPCIKNKSDITRELNKVKEEMVFETLIITQNNYKTK